mgnify:FL=1
MFNQKSNPSSLGGGMPGIANKLIGGGANSTSGSGMDGGSTRSRNRFTLREAWNGSAASGKVNNKPVIATPFRAVNNAGDLLCRTNYVSGGSNQVTNVRNLFGWGILAGSVTSKNDGSGVPSATCNTKFVYDGSDYTSFKKLQAINRNYNDYSFGGSNNSNQTAIAFVRS